MQVRETTEADAERLAELIDGVCRERRYLAATRGFSVESTRAFLASVRQVQGVHLVAVTAESLIGWCDVVPQGFEGMKHVGRLGMGVHRDHRSRGVGEMLLSSALQRSFQQGLERIELEVFATNGAAIRLYERHGFGLEGRKVAARKLDGLTDDILLYAKRSPA